MNLRLVCLIFILLQIWGCARVEPTPTETHPPTPTRSVVAINTATNEPQSTSSPIAVGENTSPDIADPTETEEVLLQPEKVSILAPGPGSFITSPVRVRGRAGPAWLDRVQITLIGEDGRTIAESVAFLYNLPGNLGPYNLLFEFSTSLVAEAGRIEVRNFSPYDGKLDHMASVDVTLISIGTDRIYYTLHGPEKLEINSPRQFETLSGGQVTVTGAGWVASPTPLKLEILDANGDVLSSADVALSTAEIGVAGTFESTLTYSVEAPQRGRIALYEPSSTIPGVVHYTSIIVQLNP